LPLCLPADVGIELASLTEMITRRPNSSTCPVRAPLFEQSTLATLLVVRTEHPPAAKMAPANDTEKVGEKRDHSFEGMVVSDDARQFNGNIGNKAPSGSHQHKNGKASGNSTQINGNMSEEALLAISGNPRR